MKDLIIDRGSKTSKERASISMVKETMQYNLELFSGKEEIWPDQCDCAISSLNTTKTLVQKLCEVFDKGSYHSIMVTAARTGGDITVPLYYAHEQLGELQELVSTFRTICRAPSKQARKKREEIFHKLELLMLHSEDILQSITILQQEPLLERLAQYASETASALSPSPLEECQSSSCQRRPPTEREFVDPAQWKRSYPDYLRLMPKGSVETSHDLPLEAEEDASESPFCG